MTRTVVIAVCACALAVGLAAPAGASAPASGAATVTAKAAVPALKTALADEDQRVRDAAAKALAAIEGTGATTSKNKPDK